MIEEFERSALDRCGQCEGRDDRCSLGGAVADVVAGEGGEVLQNAAEGTHRLVLVVAFA